MFPTDDFARLSHARASQQSQEARRQGAAGPGKPGEPQKPPFPQLYTGTDCPVYAFAEQQAERDALRIRLQNAVQRLGPYEADSNFADPRLMASHMLNQLDRVN
jgi:hypothetical protein